MKNLSQISKALALISVLFTVNSFAAIETKHPVPGENDVLLNFGFASERAISPRMNILIWNLHKGSNNTFATDFVELAYQKNLIMAEEMFLNPAMRIVFSIFPQYYFSTATSFFMGKEQTRTGVATSSTVMPIEQSYIKTDTLEPIIDSPKVTLVTRFPIKNSKAILTVVNIHGINFVDATSYKKEITKIYEVIKKYPSPLIFAGDFNSWSDERNETLNDLRKKMNLSEAQFSPDNRLRFNKHPLDHFFFTKDIKVIDAKVEEFYQGSDHKPLELIVEYSPTKTN